MDLAALVSDKQLLATLTREYELLKATNASINYEEWITRRLQVAAAAKQQRGPAVVTSTAPAYAAAQTVRQSATFSQPTGARQVGPSASSQQLPPKGSVMAQPHWEPWEVVNQVPLHQQEPEASVNTALHATPRASTQPQWVAAAKLQASLQSSAVVPLMHAAADRDRKLADTAALVRQQLALSGSMDSNMADLQRLYLQQQQQQEESPAMKHVGSVHKAAAVEHADSKPAISKQRAAQQDVAIQTTTKAATMPKKETTSAADVDLQPTSTTADHQHKLPQELLTEKVKNSWLVKAALQPSNKQILTDCDTAGSAAPPDFIRIAGEAGKQAEQQHSSKASQEQPAATSRRNQLKAALKQLLAYGSAAGQQPNVAESLQRVLRMQQAQTQQQGVFAGQQQQLHQVASQLQQLLQSLHIQPNKQQWRHSSKRWEQDENVNPSFDMRTQQSPSSGNARQHLRFLQQQRQLRQLQAATTAAATTGLVGVSGIPAKLQAQQQQQLRDKPAWQSDVYVAPPSQLLKRKNAGFADVWNMQPRRRPSSARPSSAGKVRSSRPASAAKTPLPAARNKLQKRLNQQWQQRQQQGEQPSSTPLLDSSHQADKAHGGYVRHHLSPVQENSDEQLFARDLLAAAAVARYGRHSNAGQQQVGQSSAATGFGDMTPDEVQDIEQEVKKQLEKEEQQQEARRLTRLEETSSHILTVLARLEQQIRQTGPTPQPLPAAAAAGTTNVSGVKSSAEASLLGDPTQLSDLLDALDRMEAQENEISQRWFAGNEAVEEPAASAPADTQQTESILEMSKDDGSSLSSLHQPIAAVGFSTGSCTAPPPESVVDLGAQEEHRQQQQLSKEALKSIKSGRRRFLKHQAAIDGQVSVLGVGGHSSTVTQAKAGQHMQPTLVVEAVADLLIDELLADQVGELDDFMDALCDQLFESEFAEA